MRTEQNQAEDSATSLTIIMSASRSFLRRYPDIEAPTLLPDAAGPSQCGWLHDGHGADASMLWDEKTKQVGLVHKDRQEQATFRAAVDGGSVGMVTSRGFEIRDLVASGLAALQAMADARDIIGIGSAAMLMGCARCALDISVAYLRTRQQFGVLIGSFQALQHRFTSPWPPRNRFWSRRRLASTARTARRYAPRSAPDRPIARCKSSRRRFSFTGRSASQMSTMSACISGASLRWPHGMEMRRSGGWTISTISRRCSSTPTISCPPAAADCQSPPNNAGRITAGENLRGRSSPAIPGRP
jgi:hypothetical protein